MMIGLKKRPTYDELTNHLDEDPIKHYPDRRATEFENSNCMSQLALGFQEVVEQNNRIMKENYYYKKHHHLPVHNHYIIAPFKVLHHMD